VSPDQLLSYLALLVVTGVLLFWIAEWRVSRRPGVRAMCLALLGLQVGMTLGVPPVRAFLAGLVPLPAAAHLLQHSVVLWGAYHLAAFARYLVIPQDHQVPPTLRRRRILLLVSLAALLVCYVLGPLPARMELIEPHRATVPFVGVYLGVFATYLGVALLDVALAARHARRLTDPGLRWGLWLLGTGALSGVLYVLHKVGYAALTAAGLRPPWPEYGPRGVAGYLVPTAVLLMMAGSLLPPLCRRWELYRLCRRLDPLWQALTKQAPELRFHQWHPLLRPVSRQLRQRVTEIRDVLAGPLERYLDPAVAAEARRQAAAQGQDSAQQRVAAAAAVIAAALAAHRSGRPAVDPDPTLVTDPEATTYVAEARWLADVADAWRRLPSSSASSPTP